MYNFNTKFDYDLLKSKSNLEKHGVSFEEAAQLWSGAKVRDVKTRYSFEDRWMRVGQIDGKLYSCFYTLREDAVRIISCRRSREDEKELYHEETEEKD